jgi:hypothetical protein
VRGLPSRTAQETLPWSWYSDPELLRREQERIFHGAWQYAGPAEQVASPGEFTCRFGGAPVIESVQAGVRSGLLDEGRLMPESERLIAHFQGLVWEALA